MSAIAFDAVAMPTEELQVLNMIRAADSDSDNVIDFKVLYLKVLSTAVTVARLLPVKQCFVGIGVIRQNIPKIGSKGHIGTVDNAFKQALIRFDAIHNQFSGFR